MILTTLELHELGFGILRIFTVAAASGLPIDLGAGEPVPNELCVLLHRHGLDPGGVLHVDRDGEGMRNDWFRCWQEAPARAFVPWHPDPRGKPKPQLDVARWGLEGLPLNYQQLLRDAAQRQNVKIDSLIAGSFHPLGINGILGTKPLPVTAQNIALEQLRIQSAHVAFVQQYQLERLGMWPP